MSFLKLKGTLGDETKIKCTLKRYIMEKKTRNRKPSAIQKEPNTKRKGVSAKSNGLADKISQVQVQL